MKILNTAVAAALLVPPTSAFLAPIGLVTHRNTSPFFAVPSESEENMGKAKEKNNGEIESLKKKPEDLESPPGPGSGRKKPKVLKSSPGPGAGLDISQMTKEEVAQKLLSYQQFLAKYIVDSKHQQAKAIAAAEDRVKQQYEEKLKLLSGSADATGPASTAAAASPAFQQRSAKVSAAAAAGKSRWGDLENEKAGKLAGDVNGAAKVNGAAAPPVLAAPASTMATVLFDKRNAMVAAAGKAGKSRWGDMEVAKASQAAAKLPSTPATAATPAPAPAPVPAAPLPVPPEVKAADHGLRADGGVGGPSLAERINLGAQLVDAPAAVSVVAPAPAPLGSTKAPSSYYEKRNAMVAAAGMAGKSRWGEKEVERAQSLAASLPSSSSAASEVKVTPEIEAADHGLRADGGVGGPSLAQRVNLGASLVGQ